MPGRALHLIETSPLRYADPRAKLALGIGASAAVALPLERLAVCCLGFALLVVAGGLTEPVAHRLSRATAFLAALFFIDALVLGLAFAALITLRLALLLSAFTLVLATTTSDELRAALERLMVPRRFAFTFATAFCSVAFFEDELRGILEAQRARGMFADPLHARPKSWRARLEALVPLAVPAIVLATKRAWAIHEAAAARGFDHPDARCGQDLKFRALDYGLLGAPAALMVALLVWQ
jgi:energy-coupling factor transporter transmembrane protein EcfT